MSLKRAGLQRTGLRQLILVERQKQARSSKGSVAKQVRHEGLNAPARRGRLGGWAER
jgi:hypothetical protein